MKRYQIDTNQVVELLQKASLSMKSQKLDEINSVRNQSAKSASNNAFTKEFLKQQLSKDSSAKKQKSLSNQELVIAMQKYNQLLQTKKDSARSQSKNTQLLNTLVTKVNPSLELNMVKQVKPPTPTETQSHRASTSDSKLQQQFQHRRQQSNGSKDQIYKKLYQTLLQKPKTQSQQVTPVAAQQIGEKKFFESNKRLQTKDLKKKGVYYLEKVRQSFTKPLRDDYFSKMYREHYFQTYQGIYVAQYLRPADQSDLLNKQVHLVQNEYYKNKITIVFDLDETLVHCNENISMPSDIVLEIQISPQEIIKAGINIRPGAIQLLESLAPDFEIIVFTASHQCYASKVIEYLDPKQKLISHKLFRDNCIMTTGGMYTKDLRIFNRPLSQIVLVDNAAYSYAWQIDNGIPIVPFYDHKADRELDTLRQYLQGMKGEKDVRVYNKNNLKLQYFTDSSGPAIVFERLFSQKMDI